MLPSILEEPDKRRQPNEVRAVPKNSPAQTILGNNVPYFCQWDNNPPKKQVLYTMRSMIDKKLYDCVIDMSMSKFKKAYAAWIQGVHIQHAFPTLTPEIREFIRTGITPTQWNDMFKEEE
jgi:hypothetical protein